MTDQKKNTVEPLSILEFARLLEIIHDGLEICKNDYDGVTGNYDYELEEALMMIKKAIKIKKNEHNSSHP